MVRERLVPESLCRELRACIEQGKAIPRSYQGIVDPALRHTEFVVVQDALEFRIASYVRDPLENFFGIATRSVPGQSMLIYRYPVGVGFVSHHDEPTTIEEHRAETNGQPVIRGDLTIIVSVNGPDEYEGGGLYFDDPDIGFRLPAGSVVAFPATRHWLHGVLPILAGERLTALMRVIVEAPNADGR
jgi:PKHD-type hydroxylase